MCILTKSPAFYAQIFTYHAFEHSHDRCSKSHQQYAHIILSIFKLIDSFIRAYSGLDMKSLKFNTLLKVDVLLEYFDFSMTDLSGKSI